MRLSFRKAEEKDWRVVLNLGKIGSENGRYIAATKEKDAKAYVKKSDVFIIEKKGEPVGNVSYAMKGKNHAYLDGLTVLPEYQRHGIAAEATDFIMDKLKNVEKISFHTHPHNSAVIKIALDRGFRIESWAENKFGDGEPRLLLMKVK